MQAQGSDSMAAPLAEQLAQLRDIHAPDSVRWWPLAPGWWFLAGVLLLTLLVLLWWWQRRRRNAWQRLALHRLEHISRELDSKPHALVREVELLLRRAAILHYPETECAGLSGKRWLEFLDLTLGKAGSSRPFTTGAGQCLADVPYRPETDPDVDTRALVELVRRWLHNLPALKAQTTKYQKQRRGLC